jgi:hypothetical protein
MALRIIEGVPGAGKTFYAVWHLARNYFKKVFKDEEPVYGFFLNLLYALLPFLKPTRACSYELARECTIISNIDGFKPHHISLIDEIERAGELARQKIKSSDMTERQKETALHQLDPVAEFFSYAYQEKYKEGKSQIVYVIDEAQRFFRKGMDKVLKDRRVFDYFEYHRHWGQDIYLVTQNIKKLPPDIVYLVEYTVSAVPRVRSLGPGFRYHWMASGERIKTEVRRPEQAIFALYKSMDVAEQEKIKNPVLKSVGLALLGAFLIIFYGFSYISDRFGEKEKPAVAAPAVSSPSIIPDYSRPLGESYVPVGQPRLDPPPPRYVVFLPLDSITSYSGNAMQTLYVWRGVLLPANHFPHETFRMAGQLYAVIDYDVFEFYFPEGENRPTDFIVQVASPEPQPGDGAKANTHSAARSDLSGEPARTGAQATKQG